MIEELKSMGLNLFPLQPKSKIPALEWGQYKGPSAKRFEGLITRDYGVVCGIASDNLFVVDLDTADLYPVFEGFAKQTLVVKNGKGYHIYFKTDNKLPKTVPLINAKGQKMDIRSEGSFVVGPGSIHESGAVYTVISEVKTIMKIDPIIIKDILAGLGFEFNAGSEFAPPINEIVKFVPIGMRNNATFKYAAHLIGNLDLPDDMVWAEIKRWATQLDFQCPESELRTVFESAKKRVKRPNQTIPIKEALERARSLNLVNMHDITASKYEGKSITFDAFIAIIQEHKTIVTQSSATCPDCGSVKIVNSNNYENVKQPYCSVDQSKMNLRNDENRRIEDVRTVVLQEFPEEAETNSPKRFIAKIKGDKVNQVSTGARKRITGTLMSKMDKDKEENRPIILIEDMEDLDEDDSEEITIDVLDKIQSDINEKFIEEKLVTSFAPDIHGHEEVKELILYTIAGGVKVGSRRGDINFGIPGNPSKGKSQMLKFAKEITFKSDYVNGRGSSSAGLLYGMVKMPDGTMAPQPGPFVINSGGFVFIDEMDKMKRDDRHGLLEAMEQQTVSLAKAGVNICVPAETAVIAAFNPHFGRWDKTMSIMDNLQPLEKPLLSRFDIMYPIIIVSKEVNDAIADHIVDQNESGEKVTYMDKITLKHYLQYVRKSKPTLSKEAGKLIKEYYKQSQEIMENSEDNKKLLPMEERQLEGLIRLSTARAKLLRKSEVDVNDVERIITLSKKAIEAFGIDVNYNTGNVSLNTDKENQQHTFLKLFKSLEDENGIVTKTQLREALSNHPKFSNKSPDEIISKALKDWHNIYNPTDSTYKRL